MERIAAMRKRPAFTLIEIAAAMAVTSVLLAIAAGLLHALFRFQEGGQERLRQRVAMDRLARQFREDVHAASGLTGEGVGSPLRVGADASGTVETLGPRREKDSRPLPRKKLPGCACNWRGAARSSTGWPATLWPAASGKATSRSARRVPAPSRREGGGEGPGRQGGRDGQPADHGRRGTSGERCAAGAVGRRRLGPGSPFHRAGRRGVQAAGSKEVAAMRTPSRTAQGLMLRRVPLLRRSSAASSRGTLCEAVAHERVGGRVPSWWWRSSAWRWPPRR